MKRLTAYIILACLAAGANAQTSAKESAVRGYYTGFEKKDWNTVSAQFAEDFTFTSPNNDDHIPIDKFKEKCFSTAKYVKKVNYIKMIEKGDDLLLVVEINTTSGDLVRNVDLFNFDAAGKIRSIEVFFGAGTKFPGSKQ
jgi:SnoaL-like domain